jgi:glycine cleavage system H protein
MDIPTDLRFTGNHEWARREGGRIRFGITDFAQDALGDVVYLELPKVGLAFEMDAKVGEVESTKSVSEIYAPVGGIVIEVNGVLVNQPELLNQDPYGAGWLCVVEPSNVDDFNSLMSDSEYEALTQGK